MLHPALTTLAPQFERMGELAAQMLMKLIDGAPAESAAIPPALMMRATVSSIKADA